MIVSKSCKYWASYWADSLIFMQVGENNKDKTGRSVYTSEAHAILLVYPGVYLVSLYIYREREGELDNFCIQVIYFTLKMVKI